MNARATRDADGSKETTTTVDLTKPPEAFDVFVNTKLINISGQCRSIVGQAMLALVRKEIGPEDMSALAKGLDSISASLYSEVKMAKAVLELADRGMNLGSVENMGKMMIGVAVEESEGPR